MMMIPLTLLQRGVIIRLREAGFPETADRAHDTWSAGERLPDVFLTVEMAQKLFTQMSVELRDDLVRANAHAVPNV